MVTMPIKQHPQLTKKAKPTQGVRVGFLMMVLMVVKGAQYLYGTLRILDGHNDRAVEDCVRVGLFDGYLMVQGVPVWIRAGSGWTAYDGWSWVY